MTIWSVQKQTHGTAQNHTYHQDATYIQHKHFCDFQIFLKKNVMGFLK